MCNRHTTPDIGLDIITNRKGTSLQQAIEYLEQNIPHLPSYLTYDIQVEDDLTTISYELQDFYTFSRPLSQEEEEEIARRKQNNPKNETNDDNSNASDDIDLLIPSSNDQQEDKTNNEQFEQEQNEETNQEPDKNEPKDVFATPQGRLRQLTMTQVYEESENNDTKPLALTIPGVLETPSGLTRNTPQVEDLNEIELKSKLIADISVSKLKKLQKLMKSDDWEHTINTPTYLSQQYGSMSTKTQQLEKSVGERIKKDMNKSKQDELDEFAVSITQTMDEAQTQFKNWIHTESEKHGKYMKQFISDIESKSVQLEKLKMDIEKAEKGCNLVCLAIFKEPQRMDKLMIEVQSIVVMPIFQHML